MPAIDHDAAELKLDQFEPSTADVGVAKSQDLICAFPNNTLALALSTFLSEYLALSMFHVLRSRRLYATISASLYSSFPFIAVCAT